MPPPDPYDPTPLRFTEGMAKEFIKNMRPSGENVFSKKHGQAATSYWVPAIAVTAAMRYFLGYEAVTTSAPYRMMRKNPVRHPKYENLWCRGCSEMEFKPDSQTAETLKKQFPYPLRTGKPARFPDYSGYKWASLLCNFEPVDYPVLEDSDPDFIDLSTARMEWLRNVSIDTDPRVEEIHTKFTYTFAEGENALAPYTNPKNTPVLAERGWLVVRSDMVFRWTDVPEGYIMRANTKRPENILNALGKVNDADFQGYLAGTLLFMGAKLVKSPWTLKPNVTGIPFEIAVESDFLYDIDLHFNFFDPTKGFTGQPPAQIITNRGHNNFPFAGNQAVGQATDPNGGRWFLATLNGATTGATLFEKTSFPKIFDTPLNNP